MMNTILVISGFDATASAGILLDAHISWVLGVQPYCILPAFLVQNHHTVNNRQSFTKNEILTQLQAIKVLPSVAKIGLLQTVEAVIAMSEFFKKYPEIKLIVDTPMISSSGKQLVDDIDPYIEAFKKHLLPLAYLLTPNTEELKLFGGVEEIMQTGCKNVLVKGGHGSSNMCIDALITHNSVHEVAMPRIDFTENIRGTGCGLSTAITCYIAQGKTLEEAVHLAKHFVFRGIHNSVKVNKNTRIMQF